MQTFSKNSSNASNNSDQYVKVGNLQVNCQLYSFVNNEALPNSGLEENAFWAGFEKVLQDFTPVNQSLLEKRDNIQSQIDAFHQIEPDADFSAYKSFLTDIGYLVEQPAPFAINTQNVDDEIATLAGPQLVVPINNARYALNAVNARWGSLYDALYGTDAIAEEDGLEKTTDYNPKRGLAVITKARELLNTIVPLNAGSHTHSTGYKIENGALKVDIVEGNESLSVQLADPSQFVGFTGSMEAPTSILLRHNGLHAELQIDPTNLIGQSDPAGLKDIALESALTTIMDCEDSVAAVDAEDKTLVYQNWLGLMKGTLSLTMKKGDKTIERKMEHDRQYTSVNNNGEYKVSGRSLMFVRNVGHLMRNDAILLNGEPVFEGIMDGVITSLIGKHDLLGNGTFQNSKKGSIYIVKPKMHGPEEVKLTNDLFNAIEDILCLERFTLKVGIMDEERRTSVNLAACIYEAKDRVVFINTGFLDRTGDEIHTSMLKGPFAPKADLKQMPWIQAYENANVSIGLTAGLSGKAQIGKGMWPIPDQMANMLAAKIGHPKSGANTAWVPSPTGATLHALHYHEVDVFEVQKGIKTDDQALDTILQIPLMDSSKTLTDEEIKREIDNNIQGILGYVVRWVHQGIGCSKVPDINNVGLMEDRATLRISSQHLANWLAHGIINEEQVQASLLEMAKLVDEQNKDDAEYIPMGPNYTDTIGFQAASALIFEGKEQPSGYTEPLLHAKRIEMKRKMATMDA